MSTRKATLSIIRCFTAVALAMSLSGCFTGIESTPKITEQNLKKANVIVTDEQRLLADIRPEPISEWGEGKPLFVTDEKISIVLAPSDSTPRQETILLFAGVDSVKDVTGGYTSVMQFRTAEGQSYSYPINKSPSEISNATFRIVPFTIDLDLVEQVKQRLVSKRLWVLGRIWYYDNGQQVTGRKFVPVEIVDVVPGNDSYPLMVVFDDDNHERRALYMSLPGDPKATRPFDSLFSFTDPRRRYKSIPSDHWQLIIDGKVDIDMTREECRLSLGAPASIDRIAGYSGVAERWTYEDGSYLIFNDGLLQQFRQ